MTVVGGMKVRIAYAFIRLWRISSCVPVIRAVKEKRRNCRFCSSNVQAINMLFIVGAFWPMLAAELAVAIYMTLSDFLLVGI